MPDPKYNQIPPCTGDPTQHILAKRGGKYYWRSKRGSNKPAVLNASLAHRNQVMKNVSPFVKEIRQLLKPHNQYMKTGGLHQQLYKLLEKPYADTGLLDFTGLLLADLQPDHPLDHLLQAGYKVKGEVGKITVEISASPHAVKKHNSIVTEFAFEFFLLQGSPGSLDLINESSPVFNIENGLQDSYLHEMPIPSHRPWMLIFKVCCFEGKEWARSGRHYGMKVVGVG